MIRHQNSKNQNIVREFFLEMLSDPVAILWGIGLAIVIMALLHLAFYGSSLPTDFLPQPK